MHCHGWADFITGTLGEKLPDWPRMVDFLVIEDPILFAVSVPGNRTDRAAEFWKHEPKNHLPAIRSS
jgi:hypothetical protein